MCNSPSIELQREEMIISKRPVEFTPYVLHVHGQLSSKQQRETDELLSPPHILVRHRRGADHRTCGGPVPGNMSFNKKYAGLPDLVRCAVDLIRQPEKC